MIAVVVPTIRPEQFNTFLDHWRELFERHNVELLAIKDGDDPILMHLHGYTMGSETAFSLSDYPEIGELVYNRNDGVRNFGFFYVANYLLSTEYIITLDDDVRPIGDPIQDHIDALNNRVPISWMPTASEYTRGVPYGVREEAEVVLSHGVWEGVKDWDAPTQLVAGNKDVRFYRGPIPKGIYYPMCGMNIAFKMKMLPYMYFAPMGHKIGLDRFADIWLGITSKRIIDENGWAVVTGYSQVQHDRASNVWKNLQKEARGLELNETFWQGDEADPYFKLYAEKREAWFNLISPLLS